MALAPVAAALASVARRAALSRAAARSDSTFLRSALDNTPSERCGGISWTRGKAGGSAERSGVPSGSPPTAVGRLEMTDEHPAMTVAALSASTICHIGTRRRGGSVLDMMPDDEHLKKRPFKDWLNLAVSR